LVEGSRAPGGALRPARRGRPGGHRRAHGAGLQGAHPALRHLPRPRLRRRLRPQPRLDGTQGQHGHPPDRLTVSVGAVPSDSRRLPLLATPALLGVTACWGSTFFLIHDLLARVPTLDFLAVRFAIASVTLVLLAPKALGRLTRESRRHAVVLGCLYGVAQILQTAGLAQTPASISGFITGMYVVATPVFAALILGTRVGVLTWVAVLVAMAGPAVLTLSGFSIGDRQTR